MSNLEEQSDDVVLEDSTDDGNADIEDSDEALLTDTNFTETKFDFDSLRVIINIQILPCNSDTNRTVLIAIGIPEETPILSVVELSTLSCPALQQAILKLKEELPSMAENAAKRKQKALKAANTKAENKHQIKISELPTSQNKNPSNQLSLFQ
ncbi:hypothetical protein WA1_49070 [Scytonema hofmannii PCC 7110]|uniref:Uncharacterized protein n=1 Tax=Scytonema hofmannii PCC 7110 TaxID=128403 RepID=A0A139WQI5_9CYAN|nr:hypothetical protein [Scytonema hofmannii]KYC34694.1 hypothetical protein WA1_49070 [Scytonema hofmannii PCC 7110]